MKTWTRTFGEHHSDSIFSIRNKIEVFYVHVISFEMHYCDILILNLTIYVEVDWTTHTSSERRAYSKLTIFRMTIRVEMIGETEAAVKCHMCGSKSFSR